MGTPAAEFGDQVDHEEKTERLRYLQAIQDEITTERNLAQRGSTLEVLIDQVENGQTVGRSFREAPEIDGVILLESGKPGDWVRATVTGGYGTDLVGEVVG